MEPISRKPVQPNRALLLSALLAIAPPSIISLIIVLNSFSVSGFITWPALALWLYIVLNYVFHWEHVNTVTEE